MLGCRKAVVAVVAIALFATIGAGAEEPATIRVSLYERGLAKVKDAVLARVVDRAGTYYAPSVNGSKLGFHYEISHMKASGLKMEPKDVTLSLDAKEERMVLKAVDVGVNVTFDFSAYLFFKSSETTGNATVSLSGATMSMPVQFGAKDGYPQLEDIRDVECTFEDISVKFSKSFVGYLGNMMTWLARNRIKDMAEETIREKLGPLVKEEANKVLRSVPVVERVTPSTTIDLRVTDKPTIVDKRIDSYHVGDLSCDSQEGPSPGDHHKFPAEFLAGEEKDIIIGIDEYMMDTVGNAFYVCGDMAHEITDDMIPSTSPYRLNSDSFKTLIPALSEKYPETPMVAVVKASKSPDVTITSGGANAHMSGDVSFYVIPKNADGTPGTEKVFVFNFLGRLLVDGIAFTVDGALLTGKARSLKFSDVKAGRCEVGDLPDGVGSTLETMLNFGAGIFGLGALNKVLTKGARLPVVHGIKMIEPEVKLLDGFLVIGSSVEFELDAPEKGSDDFFGAGATLDRMSLLPPLHDMESHDHEWFCGAQRPGPLSYII